jgi:hypothetical protein
MAQPQPNLVELKSLTNTPNPIQLGSSQGNYTPGVIAMSMGGTLYESLSLMASYDMTIQQQYLEYQQDLAKANVGIVNNYLTTSIDAANEQAQATRNQAYGELASGCIGLATFGASTGAILKSGDPVTQSKLEDAQSFQKELNETSGPRMVLQETTDAQIAGLKAEQVRTNDEAEKAAREDKVAQNGKKTEEENVAACDVKGIQTQAEQVKAKDALTAAQTRARAATDAKTAATTRDEVTQAEVEVGAANSSLTTAESAVTHAGEAVRRANDARAAANKNLLEANNTAKDTSAAKVLAVERSTAAGAALHEANNNVKFHARINKRIKEWASGNKDKLANFTQDEEFNKTVVGQLKGRPSEYEAASKNVSELISELQKTLDQALGKYQTFLQMAQLFQPGASGIAQGAAGTYQATEQQKGQSDAARADVIKSLEGQWNGNMNNAQQSANQFAQSAMQAAAAFGTISQTRA